MQPNNRSSAKQHAELNPKGKYRPEIDGLRALAVMSVLMFHAGLGFSGGYVGVDVFFVISGFLITGIIFNQLVAGCFSLSEFYDRRIRRIAPALFVTILATLFASYFILLTDDFCNLGRAVVVQPVMLSNLFHWRSLGYFSHNVESFPLLHTWSLAVEEQFYLVFPLLLVFIYRVQRRTVAPAILVIFTLSLALSVWATPQYSGASFYLLPTRAWELCLGAILAILPYRHPISPKRNQILSCLGLLLILVAVFMFDSKTTFPGYFAVVPTVGTAMLIRSTGFTTTFVGKLLAMQPLVFLGRISYSLYLIHWPVISLYLYWNWDDTNPLHRISLVVVSLFLAFISYYVIETPIRTRRILRSRKNLLFALSVSTIMLVFAWQAIERNQGFTSTHDSQIKELISVRGATMQFGHNLTPEKAITREFLTFGDTKGTLYCMVWGDSHAKALLPAIDEACRRSGGYGFQATYNSTPPLIDFIPKDPSSLRDRSPIFSRAIIDSAIDLKVPVVIMAAFWQSYSEDPDFKHSLRRTVDKLIGAGIKVVIVRDVATFAEDVPKSLIRAMRRGEDVSRVGTTLRQHLKNNFSANRAFNDLTTQGVTIMDPSTCFIDEHEFWPCMIDGKCMYIDSHHLSSFGSLRLSSSFKDILDSIHAVR